LLTSINVFPLPTSASSVDPGPLTLGPDGALWFDEDLYHVLAPPDFHSFPELVSDPGRIGRITSAGDITQFSLAGAVDSATSLTVGPDGNLWFPEYLAGQGPGIGRITPTGTVTEFPLLPLNYGSGAMTVGPDGNLWFGYDAYAATPPGVPDVTVHGIGRITPTGVVTEFPLPTGDDRGALTLGPDGNLWFSYDAYAAPPPGVPDVTVYGIGRITPTGVVTEFPLPTGDGDSGALALGPDGNLWFPETGKIGRITPAGAITEFPLPDASSQPGMLTVGSDGNLWFSVRTFTILQGNLTSGGQIGRITLTGVVTEFPLPNTVTSVPGALTAAPDGNLWLLTPASTIDRITPTGAVTEFPLPSGVSSVSSLTVGPDGNLLPPDVSPVNSLTVGPDGNLWFSGYGPNSPQSIGQVILDKPPSVTGVVSVTQSKKGITQIILGVSEDLNPASAENVAFYSLDLGVKKRHKLVFSKPVKIHSVSYDNNAHTVTLKLAKRAKGTMQVTVHGGIFAANGLSSSGDFTAVVK
jgi:virginiamycin B lyase